MPQTHTLPIPFPEVESTVSFLGLLYTRLAGIIKQPGLMIEFLFNGSAKCALVSIFFNLSSIGGRPFHYLINKISL